MNALSPEAILHLRMQMEIGISDVYFEDAWTGLANKVEPKTSAVSRTQAPSNTSTNQPPTSTGESLLVIPKSTPVANEEEMVAIEAAQSLDQLHDAMMQHPFYRLAAGKAGRIALSSGPMQPALMLVGEWPTEEELRLGGFYAGAAGELLRKLLDNLHHSRNLCYATWFCKKPALKAPLPRQAILLRRMLAREAQIVQPKMILLLGEQSLRSILQKSGDLEAEWGRAQDFAGIPTVAIASPREMMDDPRKKAVTWNDHIPRSGLFRKKV